MNYVLTAKEMKNADMDTIQYYGVPQLVLMERAALECKREILHKWAGILKYGCSVLVVLGTGNNGGDGAALARMLYLDGYRVDIWADPAKERYSDALKQQLEICQKYGLTVKNPGQDQKSFSDCFPDAYDLVIDAMFGIGLSRDITGYYEEKMAFLNQLGGIKVAMDIPSGIHTDHGSVMGCAFRADMTVTFAAIKTGMLLQPGKTYCGETVICDIGISMKHLRFGLPEGVTFDRDDPISGLYPVRKQNSHKGTFGKALLIAGDDGTPGAAMLAAESLLRSGIGMVRLLAPGSIRDLVLSVLPEIMFSDRNENMDFGSLLSWCDGVIIGPGLGKGERQKQILHELADLLLSKNPDKKLPIVLDADALNLLSEEENIREKYSSLAQNGIPVIVTPHLEEMRRISGFSRESLQLTRMECIRDFCRKTGFILICKDSATVVACYDKERFVYYINQSGNSGMAAAGSGDVLSGIVGTSVIQLLLDNHDLTDMELSNLLQDYPVAFVSAVRAVYLHGKAGDTAALKYGETSMTSKDIIDGMINIMKEL